jgi:sulfonate transport system substrate-binding protein
MTKMPVRNADSNSAGARKLSRRTVIAGLVAAGAPGVPGWAAGPTSIRYAYGGASGPSGIETLVFMPWMQQNVLSRYGKDYVLDVTYTRATPEAAALLASGAVDMATLSVAAFATAAIKDAVQGGMKIVAGNYENGKPGFASDTVLVLEDGPIRQVEDLKGRKVGVPAFGSASDLMVRVMLKKHGLNPRRDLEMVEVSFPNIGPALREKRIDAGIMILPFLSDELNKGGMRPLFTAAESLGSYAMVFTAAANSFLAKSPDATRAFLADYVEGLTWIYKPENRPTVLRITSELTKSTPAQLDRYFLTSRDYYRNVAGCIQASGLQTPVDAMVREGLIATQIDMARYLEMSFLPGSC